MDGHDLERRMGPALRRRRSHQDWEALRRDQHPPEAASGMDCLKATRNSDRRFEPLRRAAGRTSGLRTG